MEIVGRHHDPFTVMKQSERPPSLGVYSQPVTDTAGALLARVSGVVAGYNWLVLLSFPLAAAAAYLLARHLPLSPAGAPSRHSPSRSPRFIWRTRPITRTSPRPSGYRSTCSRCGGVSITHRRQRPGCLAPRRLR